jgi:hypothetical protein
LVLGFSVLSTSNALSGLETVELPKPTFSSCMLDRLACRLLEPDKGDLGVLGDAEDGGVPSLSLDAGVIVLEGGRLEAD